MGRILPLRWFDPYSFPYKICEFEKDGRIYEKTGIRYWQKKVPDMSRLFPFLMPRKEIKERPSVHGLEVMIGETCKAEFTHAVLSFFGLYILKLEPGIWGAVLTIVYIVFGNIIFIIIQRYNRPRLIKLYSKMNRRP